MLTATCDICNFKGEVADFLFPRNNDPIFMGTFDYSVKFDDLRALPEPTDGTMFISCGVGTDIGDNAYTSICKGCFWRGIRRMLDEYGPDTDTINYGVNSFLQSVQTEHDVSPTRPGQCSHTELTRRECICHATCNECGEEFAVTPDESSLL